MGVISLFFSLVISLKLITINHFSEQKRNDLVKLVQTQIILKRHLSWVEFETQLELGQFTNI